ncbi:MAG: methyl-accepting chemotaxis protein, partial [Lachnospiraceae bacterium]|nr:methyl-accepting chemotaxis protein [Lachnospiraceae bacterium]
MMKSGTREKRKNELKGQKTSKGQRAQLEALRKSAITTMAIGLVLLIVSIATSYIMSSAKNQQLEASKALNQYRLGSKALTYAVQSYAVTGNDQYYEDYMKELNEDKNRDNAIAILEEIGLKEDEWNGLNSIANLSNGLVPLEEASMQQVKNGNLAAARDQVFSEQYEETIDQINDLTDKTIGLIQTRMENTTANCLILQFIAQILSVLSFIYVGIRVMKCINFSEKELLESIVKVSEQMGYLANGDFTKKLELQQDETEVGVMVSAIAFMKRNMSDMIGEVSSILGQMSEGNYKFSIEKEYVGAFVEIKDSLVSIGEKMRETLHTLKEVSNQIDAGSEQLASAAQDLADGNTKQAGQVTELVEVIEDMTHSMEKSALEAQQSVVIAQHA